MEKTADEPEMYRSAKLQGGERSSIGERRRAVTLQTTQR